ncbi:MAG: hypothetical protein H8E90_00415 [Anaerolineales bacterium]|nr:hypothetical protein [Anaerolineales bacterium]
MSKRVPTGKFVMTIIGAHMTGRIPCWVDSTEVTCRTPREVRDVKRYAKIAELTITWETEGDLQVATLALWPDMENETLHASPDSAAAE